MLSLYFNNVPIPDFVKVSNIKEDILPSLEVTKGKTKLGAKLIIVEFHFRRNKLITFQQKDTFVSWLKGDNFNESKLVLPTRPDRYCMAKVNNISTIEGDIRKGNGSIEFICYDAIEINDQDNLVNIVDKNEHVIEYSGTVEIYPNLRFEITSNCNNIKLKINDKFIEFNNNFLKGDIIEFNQTNYSVRLNETINMKILHLNSKRSKLMSRNTCQLINGNCNVKLSWKNTYL